VVDLDLSKSNLHSEDIYILSMFLKNTTSLTKINLSRNFIGKKYLEESKEIELRVKNKTKLKESDYGDLFYDSLGIEHLSLALSKRPQLEYVDFSDNDIGSKSFGLLMKVFEVNKGITFVNIAD
jgi:Ran GTPase-activating protein (RanGAP) involved in mRNA processing and transport